MATTSLVPDVKARLLERLADAADLAGVAVVYALEGEQVDREFVTLASSRFSHTLPILSAGRKKRDETASIEIVFNADVPGRSAAEADARVHVMFAVLEDILADTPTLGFDQIPNGLTLTDSTSGPYPGQEGWVGGIRTTVSYVARLD
jgi:hypothetical protein